MDNKAIIYNAIVTPDGTKLVSRHRHDFKTHKDAVTGLMYGVDGGLSYLRRIGDDLHGAKDLSQYDDGGHAKRRVFLEWGVNYTKDMVRLPETEYVAICELETDHIKKILSGGHCNSGIFLETFNDELELRGENIARKINVKFTKAPTVAFSGAEITKNYKDEMSRVRVMDDHDCGNWLGLIISIIMLFAVAGTYLRVKYDNSLFDLVIMIGPAIALIFNKKLIRK